MSTDQNDVHSTDDGLPIADADTSTRKAVTTPGAMTTTARVSTPHSVSAWTRPTTKPRPRASQAEKKPASSAVVRGAFSAKGGADFLAALPEPLITDAILSRGIGLEDARKEVAALVAWVKSLGTGRVELDITEKEWKLDLVWELK